MAKSKKAKTQPKAKVAKKQPKATKSKTVIKKQTAVLTYDQKRARWRVDPKTGKALSRYSYEKKYGRKTTRQNVRTITNKFHRYIDLRDSFIDKQNAKRIKKGLKPLSKREAMASDELKQMIADLHKGQKLKRAGKIKEGNKLMLKALKKTSRRDGVPDNIPVGETATQGGNQ